MGTSTSAGQRSLEPASLFNPYGRRPAVNVIRLVVQINVILCLVVALPLSRCDVEQVSLHHR